MAEAVAGVMAGAVVDGAACSMLGALVILRSSSMLLIAVEDKASSSWVNRPSRCPRRGWLK